MFDGFWEQRDSCARVRVGFWERDSCVRVRVRIRAKLRVGLRLIDLGFVEA
jgi:hypothetical protein